MTSNKVSLNCGITMPAMGMGTYTYQYDRSTTEQAIRMALKLGYRHFDTAKIYGSEPAVGNVLTEAILDQRVNREDVFVTSKLWGSDHHDPVSALEQTLKNLGMEYLDMYLVHWPVKLKPGVYTPVPNEEDFDKLDIESTWGGMERCLDLGLCKCIGVCNFSSKKIVRLLDFASVPPAVNQAEIISDILCGARGNASNVEANEAPRSLCRTQDPCKRLFTNWWAWKCMGNQGCGRSPSHKIHCSQAQSNSSAARLKWGLSIGASVIVKSFNPDRLKENREAFNVKLDNQDLAEIDKLDERKTMRGEVYVNETSSPYRTIEELWDNEI